jgi:AcrR family transcriptional regulator
MSPRPYRLGQRRAATEATRARILEATRELLMASGAPASFSIDAVASQAGVARMTVYYQFGSRRGLLEALCDDLAERGGMSHLAGIFQERDPLVALRALIGAFVHFWATDRLVTRRLRCLAALDPDFQQVRARDEWRRGHLRVLLERVVECRRDPAGIAFDETVDILQTLTSFETYDALCNPGRSEQQVAEIIWRLARTTLNVDADSVLNTKAASRRSSRSGMMKPARSIGKSDPGATVRSLRPQSSVTAQHRKSSSD